MTQHDQDADDITRILRESYAASPDGAYAAALLHRLDGRFFAPRPWPWRSLALAAGISVVCIVGLGSYLLVRRAGPPPTPPAPPTARITADSGLPPNAPAAARAAASTLTQLVGRSPFWVRARLMSLDGAIAHYRVVYPIYGDFPDATFTVDLSDSPTDPRESAGPNTKDLVIELRPVPADSKPGTEWGRLAAEGIKYQRLASAYRADEAEAEILQAVTDGSAFDIVPRRISQMFIEAPVVVRAQLVKTEGGALGESTWKITRVLRGDAGISRPDTLIIDDQFFRQRAKAIVAAAERKQHAPSTAMSDSTEGARTSTSQPAPALVDSEINRLIDAELKPGAEAILFLDQVQTQGETLHARLRYRDYEDATRHRLDDLEDSVAGRNTTLDSTRQ